MEVSTLSPDFLECLPLEAQVHIRAIEGRLVELAARIAELEAKLNQNSTNSSKPPSSDPPSVKLPPPKTPTGKKRGGQPGHARAQRPLIDHANFTVDCVPETCRQCEQPLTGTDPQPLRHQVIELPPVVPIVTEYRQHRLACPCCGTQTCGELPAEIQGQDGPRLQAACALLTGAYRLSKSKTAQLLGDLFGIPICKAQVCATEASVGEQLVPVTAELVQAARQAPANIDETSMGKKRWLWAMVTATCTVYQIVLGRNREEFHKLIGATYTCVVTSDRYKVYMHLPHDRHQFCWAHLRRDFQAMIDRKNAGSRIGDELLKLSDTMFGWWQKVRDGTMTRVQLGNKLHNEREFRIQFRSVLERGQACGCAKTAATCKELRERELSLYVFAFNEGVEPTNNAAERAVRHGVIWRKQSHGPKSEAGALYMANIWSVVETCRQQKRNVWEYLTRCVQAMHANEPLPSLLPLKAKPQTQAA